MICPETGNCITQCAQNQFEDVANQTCVNCNPFCGGCYGPAYNKCTYCTRMPNAPVYYNS